MEILPDFQQLFIKSPTQDYRIFTVRSNKKSHWYIIQSQNPQLQQNVTIVLFENNPELQLS